MLHLGFGISLPHPWFKSEPKAELDRDKLIHLMKVKLGTPSSLFSQLSLNQANEKPTGLNKHI